MSLKTSLSTALKIFFSYAREDKDLRDTLAKQLTALKRQGLIKGWHDGEISPGNEWQSLIEKHLHLSDIILLLISPDFIASDYFYSVEINQAIDRHEKGEARIIPILLRPTDFEGLSFAKLQYLPTNGQAVTLWKNRDSAFLDIVAGIRKVVEEFVAKRLSEPPPSKSSTSTSTSPIIWKVPYRRNPLFTGRDHLLAQLHGAFSSNGAAGISIQTINGLGGIGKTQIALEYAYRYSEAYHAIFWISADPQGDITSDFVTIAQLLDLPEQNEPDQNLIIAAIKQWLQQHEHWLLLFDNIEDVTYIDELIPKTGKGNILITTRSQATGSIAIPHEIEQMEAEVGAWFLLRRAKIIAQDALLEHVRSPEGDAAQEVSRLLAGLPLALDQAGAYLEETRRSLSDYLDLYQKRRTALLSRRGKFSADHSDSVTTTFSLAFENVEQAHPGAADLLHICAFLHPDAIPEEIIIEGAVDFSSALQLIASDPFELDAAIEVLLEFSLVRRNPSTKTISVHRLVQDVLKDGMSEVQQRQWAEQAVRAVSSTFPDAEPSTWPHCQRYLPHAKVCAHLIEQWHMHFDEAIQLLNNVGYYLYKRAQYAEAELFYKQALGILEQGAEQLITAQTLYNLGNLYLDMGQYTQAEQYFLRGLRIREQILEHMHPDIAQSLNDLAGVYDHQEKYSQAEPLYQQALAIWEQMPGPEHPGVAQTLNNLALLYDHQGRYSQAEALYMRALAIREKVLGPKHIDTARILQNLARLYRLQKRYNEAEPLFVRALAIREETLGLEHPQTATTLQGLGLLYDRQGKYAEAEPLLKRAFQSQEKVLGLEHLRTITALKSLAIIYMRQEKYTEAEPLLEQALQFQEKRLGTEHADLVPDLTSLAQVYEHQEKYAQADPLRQRIIAIRKRVLGTEHPDVAIALDEYASLLHKIGKEEEAIACTHEANAIRSKPTEQEGA